MDCSINICTENYEILDSGSIIVPSNEYLEFEIKGLRFRFIFSDEVQTNTEKPVSNITGNLVTEGDTQYLAINIINFRSLFESPSKMLEVGTLEGKRLGVKFSIVCLSSENGEQTRIFYYTWYKAK